MSDYYDRLISLAGQGTAEDRHVFACLLAQGLTDGQSLSQALGLGQGDLTRLVGRYFPGAEALVADADQGCGDDSIEEPDLRRLLLDHATVPGSDEARWLSAIIARRSLRPDHLWHDLGLTSRPDLSGLMVRHFQPLASLNVRNMKWKKFLYRKMCEDEGIVVCKSPVCEQCSDFNFCYGPEE